MTKNWIVVIGSLFLMAISIIEAYAQYLRNGIQKNANFWLMIFLALASFILFVYARKKRWNEKVNKK